MNGFKFLDPTGATYFDDKETVYPLPQPGEKWGPEFVHPNPSEPDGRDCGNGRWHVMKKPSARYAPNNWWPWYVKSTGSILGMSKEKYGTTALRLRRISPKVWIRIIRLGWCKNADLWNADLRHANLRYADLMHANLMHANLRYADLMHADLRYADLRYADYNQYTTWPIGYNHKTACNT